MSLYTTDLDDLDPASREPTARELDDIERRSPADVRLKTALARIPASVQRQGMSLSTLQAEVKGRRRGSMCHAGELARALRRAGWTCRRQYGRRGTGEGVTLWFPKGVEPVPGSISGGIKLPRGRPPKWLQRARQMARESGYLI